MTATTVSGRNSPVSKKGTSMLKKPTLKDRAVQSDFSDGSGMNIPENGIEQTSEVQNQTTGSISDPVRHEPQVWRWVHIFLGQGFIRCFNPITTPILS